MATDTDGISSAPKEQGGMLMRLLRHTSNYSIGTLLITLASIISFPIFTRIFTVAEYGVLGLVNVTLGFLVGVGKMGLQKSIVRFYAEIEGGKRAGDKVALFSTVLFSMIAVGAVIALLSALIFLALPNSWWSHTGAQDLIALAAPLILFRVVDSAMLNLVNAEQRSGLYSLFTVVRKYIGLGLVLLVLFFIARNLYGFFIGTMIAEALALIFIVGYYARQRLFDIKRVSRPLFVAMLTFGLPLLASELSYMLLSMGGRYIINYQLGPQPLGSYSAAYNFSEYLQGVLTASFAQAVIPMYLRQWEQQGREKTVAFLQQALRYYLVLALPILAGMAAVGPDLLRLLASDKYEVSTSLFALIVGGMLVAGGTPIFSAGIYINKLTKVVMYSVLAAAALNIALSALLVRPYGIEGAAVATLASYLLYTAATAYYGRRAVYVPMPWRDLAKFSILALLMYGVITQIHLPSLALRIPLQILVGVVLYGSLLLVSDKPIRGLAIKMLDRLRSR
ncbi:MAG: oligosaccharide flippase family protein [Thiomonas sp.]